MAVFLLYEVIDNDWIKKRKVALLIYEVLVITLS